LEDNSLIIPLPPKLTTADRQLLWKYARRNRDCMSVERVLIVENNALGILLADRLVRNLSHGGWGVSRMLVRLSSMRLSIDDWVSYFHRRLPVPKKVGKKVREQLRQEPGILMARDHRSEK
jgi:hypothetical protein